VPCVLTYVGAALESFNLVRCQSLDETANVCLDQWAEGMIRALAADIVTDTDTGTIHIDQNGQNSRSDGMYTWASSIDYHETPGTFFLLCSC
jgi:hypothetical protein